VRLELLAIAAAAAGVACGDAAVDVAPPELGAVVHVGHLLTVRQGYRHLLVLVHAADAQVLLRPYVRVAREVGPDGLVDMVVGEGVELPLDGDGVPRGHARAQVAGAGAQCVAHLVGQQLVRHAAHQHEGRRGRRRRGEGLLVGRHGV